MFVESVVGGRARRRSPRRRHQKRSDLAGLQAAPKVVVLVGCSNLLFFLSVASLILWHKASKFKAEHLVFLRHLPGRPKKKASRTRSSRRGCILCLKECVFVKGLDFFLWLQLVGIICQYNVSTLSQGLAHDPYWLVVGVNYCQYLYDF